MSKHVHTSHQHYYSSLLSTHLPFFLAGWQTLTRRVGYNKDILEAKKATGCLSRIHVIRKNWFQGDSDHSDRDKEGTLPSNTS